ncbi:MAG TPA: PA14 domain-containing protein [Tepidisphaeraceae bacterium]|nr:PA14 domain-containing protein [Tepidisphaeraceae bacterium]
MLLTSSFATASAVTIANSPSFLAIERLFAAPARSGDASRPTASASPPVVNSGAAGSGANGLTGQYFLGTSFQNLVATHIDPAINFKWSAAPDPALTGGPFSVRWTGQVIPRFSQTYTFTIRGNVGVRLWVNGKRLVNNWKSHHTASNSGKIKLVAGTAYSLQVDSFQAGSSAGAIELLWSSAKQKSQPIPANALTVNAGALPTPAPAVPTGLTAMVSSPTDMELTWSPSAGADGYTVGRSTDGIRFTTVGTTVASQLSFDDVSVVPATAYYYEVSASNPGGVSVPGAPAGATTPPLAPGGLSANTISSARVGLQWNDVAGATGFEVLAAAGPGSDFTVVGTTGVHSTSFIATGLSPDTPYTFLVAATFGGTVSAVGNAAQAVTPIAAPQGLTAHAVTSSQIDLEWNDVSSEQGFVIERSPDGISGWGAIDTAPAGVVHASETGLTEMTSYFYRVIAVGAHGDSDPGTAAGDTTPAGVRYKYVPGQTSYSAPAGTSLTVNLYLQETVDPGRSSLLAGVGLFAAGAGVSRVSGSEASITSIAIDAADFGGPSDMSFTDADAAMIEAIGFSAPGAPLANTGGGISPSTPANEIFLGRLTIAVGAVPGTTTFSLGTHDPNGGNTLFYQSLNDLDSSQTTAPTYTGVGMATSLFTVIAT